MRTVKLKIGLAAVAASVLGIAGCRTAPRQIAAVPMYAAPGRTNGVQSPYAFSQEPVRRVLADEGRGFARHRAALAQQRYTHEQRLAAIEQAAEEKRLAAERGVSYTPALERQQNAADDIREWRHPQRQPAAAYAPQQNGGGTFSYRPPSPPAYGGGYGYRPAPYPQTSGYGSKWYHFFRPNPSGYRYYGSGYRGSGAIYGGAEFTSGLALPHRHSRREKLFGVEFEKSTPGYRDLFW